MGKIKKLADNIVEKTAEAAASAAVNGAIAGASVVAEKGAEAISFISKRVSKIIDKRNESLLKKEGKSLDNCIYISKNKEHGRGIYYAKTITGEVKYSSYLSNEDNTQFEFKLFNNLDGSVSTVKKDYAVEKGLFKESLVFLGYFIIYKGQFLGHIKEIKEGKQKVYKTDFNDWVASGDFSDGNFVILDSRSGKTLATIIKKYKKAQTFSFVCEDDGSEDLLVLFAILSDLIN